MPRKPPPPPPPVTLEGDLDIFSIQQQWGRLLPLLEAQGDTATLDLAAVGDLDLSGLQLLGALERDLKARGVRLVIQGVQGDWRTRFSLLGAGSLLDGSAP